MPSGFLELRFGFLLECLASHVLHCLLSFRDGHQGDLAGHGNVYILLGALASMLAVVGTRVWQALGSLALHKKLLPEVHPIIDKRS